MPLFCPLQLIQFILSLPVPTIYHPHQTWRTRYKLPSIVKKGQKIQNRYKMSINPQGREVEEEQSAAKENNIGSPIIANNIAIGIESKEKETQVVPTIEEKGTQGVDVENDASSTVGIPTRGFEGMMDCVHIDPPSQSQGVGSEEVQHTVGTTMCLLNKQSFSSTSSSFLVEHSYEPRGNQICTVDDESGLIRDKEPLDKGFYSDQDSLEIWANLSEAANDDEAQGMILLNQVINTISEFSTGCFPRGTWCSLQGKGRYNGDGVSAGSKGVHCSRAAIGLHLVYDGLLRVLCWFLCLLRCFPRSITAGLLQAFNWFFSWNLVALPAEFSAASFSFVVDVGMFAGSPAGLLRWPALFWSAVGLFTRAFAGFSLLQLVSCLLVTKAHFVASVGDAGDGFSQLAWGLGFKDPLGCNNTIPMPLIPQSNVDKPTVQIFPSTVSIVASSSELGIQVPFDSLIVQNTQGINLQAKSSLNSESILNLKDPLMDRTSSNIQISVPEKGIQIPAITSNVQNPSGINLQAKSSLNSESILNLKDPLMDRTSSNIQISVPEKGIQIPAITSNVQNPSEINSLTLVDLLGCNNTVTMPLVTQLNRNSPTVQIASVLPSAVLSSTNNQCSSSGLGMHIPADSSNVRNAQGVNLHSHSVLIPPPNSSPQDPSTDRLLPKTQIQIPGRDSQVPLVTTNAQNPSTIQIPSSPILFGSLNAVNPLKPTKRVVFNKGEPASVIMVNIDNAANSNNTTVDVEVGNARVIGMEDMENGRNMAVLGQTFSADKNTDIGASAADKLITDPVPQEMINVCNIANAALINDVVGVEAFIIKPGSADDIKGKELLRELKIQNPFSLIIK
ncbi:unnamed protein product, partial [Ilex paraguariensis]